MHKPAPEMQSCIDECLQCYQTCLGMSTSHCLKLGGAHAAPEHIQPERIGDMDDCVQACRSGADSCQQMAA